jgi:hypothetical protein
VVIFWNMDRASTPHAVDERVESVGDEAMHGPSVGGAGLGVFRQVDGPWDALSGSHHAGLDGERDVGRVDGPRVVQFHATMVAKWV